jgi:hypothetical protein
MEVSWRVRCLTFVSLVADHISMIPKLLTCVLCEDGPHFIVNSRGKPLDLFALNKGPISISKIEPEDILTLFIQQLRALSLVAPINSGCC